MSHLATYTTAANILVPDTKAHVQRSCGAVSGAKWGPTQRLTGVTVDQSKCVYMVVPVFTRLIIHFLSPWVGMIQLSQSLQQINPVQNKHVLCRIDLYIIVTYIYYTLLATISGFSHDSLSIWQIQSWCQIFSPCLNHYIQFIHVVCDTAGIHKTAEKTQC